MVSKLLIDLRPITAPSVARASRSRSGSETPPPQPPGRRRYFSPIGGIARFLVHLTS
jgi:hypothetical protein